MKKHFGFTLVELVACVVVVSIIATLATGVISNLNQQAQQSSAISCAQALNAAQQTYNNRVPSASTNWAAAATNLAKYQLLTAGGYIPYAPTFLNSSDGTPCYAPSGFTLTMGATLNTKVGITNATAGWTGYTAY